MEIYKSKAGEFISRPSWFLNAFLPGLLGGAIITAITMWVSVEFILSDFMEKDHIIRFCWIFTPFVLFLGSITYIMFFHGSWKQKTWRMVVIGEFVRVEHVADGHDKNDPNNITHTHVYLEKAHSPRVVLKGSISLNYAPGTVIEIHVNQRRKYRIKELRELPKTTW